jgi:hypothetical protein
VSVLSSLLIAIACGISDSYTYSIVDDRGRPALDGSVIRVTSTRTGKAIWRKKYRGWIIAGQSRDGRSIAVYDNDWRMTIWKAPGRLSSFKANPFPKDPIWADAPTVQNLFWSPDGKRIFGMFGSSGGLAVGLGSLVVFRLADRSAQMIDTKDYVVQAKWAGDRTITVWCKEFGVGASPKVYKPYNVRVP